MGRTLGIDLGTNSIGWALVEDNQIKELGTHVFNPTSQKLNIREVKPTLFDRFRKLSTNKKVSTALITSMTILTLVNIENWQFWFGLSIASLLTFLSINK